MRTRVGCVCTISLARHYDLSSDNRGVEQCVELAFPQYQWVYKRWAERPNPYEHDPYWLARNGRMDEWRR